MPPWISTNHRHPPRVISAAGRSAAVALICGAAVTWAPGAMPAAMDDVYSLGEGEALVVPVAGGVLTNDEAHGQEVEVVLVDPPASGTLTLEPGGGFRYEPAAGETGEVTFRYKVRTVVGPVEFMIDPARSRLQVEARATTDYGTANDRDDSRVAGTLHVRLRPSGEPFAAAHVTRLEARLIDALDLRLGFGCVFNFCLASVTVKTRVAAPDTLTLSLVEPGPEATVVAGAFTQTGNTFAMGGTADIAGTGLAADLLPSGPQSLDTTAVLDMTEIQITASGGTLTLRTPVEYAGRFYLDPEDTETNYVDFAARTQFTGSSGFLIATAPDGANVPDESEPATVTLTIIPAIPDADADGIADDWERANGLDPDEPDDAALDFDGDGQDNRSEFLAGTDPRSAADVLAISAIEDRGASIALIGSGLKSGRRYVCEHSANLEDWLEIGEPVEPVEPAAPQQEILLPAPTEPRFYRLRCLFTWP